MHIFHLKTISIFDQTKHITPERRSAAAARGGARAWSSPRAGGVPGPSPRALKKILILARTAPRAPPAAAT